MPNLIVFETTLPQAVFFRVGIWSTITRQFNSSPQ